MLSNHVGNQTLEIFGVPKLFKRSGSLNRQKSIKSLKTSSEMPDAQRVEKHLVRVSKWLIPRPLNWETKGRFLSQSNNEQPFGELPEALVEEMLRKECSDIANSEILMVGDSTERDIVPAKELGLKTALAKYGQKTPDTRSADYQLLNFKEIIDVVESCR